MKTFTWIPFLQGPSIGLKCLRKTGHLLLNYGILELKSRCAAVLSGTDPTDKAISIGTHGLWLHTVGLKFTSEKGN